MYFVSQVGTQPTAVAVALKGATQHPHIRLKGGLLLASERTHAAAARLQVWALRELSLDLDVQEWAASLSAQDFAAPVAGMQQWLERTPHPDAAVVFNGSAGLKTFVIALAHALSERAWFLFPEADRLYFTRPGSSEWTDRVLPRVGVDVVLELYGLRRTATVPVPNDEIAKVFRRERLRIPPGVEHWLTMANENRTTVLDLAYEARGILHAMVYVKDKEKARELRRLHLDLGGLRPRLTGVCRGATIASHLHESGIPAIDLHERAALDDLRRWLESPLPGQAPGRPLAAITERPPVRRVTTSNGADAVDAAADLAVCLGKDPTPTMLSLWTHRPDTARVYYDFKTPAVVECSDRLAAVGDLPARRLVLVPTDILGQGIAEDVSSNAKRPLRFDVTPGSKPQGWSLARLAAGTPGGEVWALRGDRQIASSFADPSRELPMEGPPLAVLAEVCGGPLREKGRHVTHGDEFWRLLGLVLRMQQKAGGAFGPLHKLLEDPLIEAHVNVESRRRAGSSSVDLQVTVSLDGSSATKWVDEANHGYWFELLVADAFLRAGANEVIAGMRWEFPATIQEELEQRHGLGVFKDDIDVAARFGARAVAVSCKAVRELQPEYRGEIEALADQKFGRFCVPILADLVFGRAGSAVPRAGCAHVDLGLLSDPPALRRWLDEVFVARSTV